MEKYTGNYAYTNHNFTIENIHGYKDKTNKYYGIICLIQNILLRGRPNKNYEGEKGNPTIMSKFLQEALGVDIDVNNQESKDRWFKEIIALIDSEKAIWDATIKGSSGSRDNPALDFYNKIPALFEDYAFIQNLIIPEVKIRDILNTNVFDEEAVDFYLAQARLVIEIDGAQHEEELAKLEDKERDHYLNLGGIKVIRISTYDIKNNTDLYNSKIEDIKKHLDLYKLKLQFFKDSFNKGMEDFTDSQLKRLQATEILRNQIVILQLLKNNIINFEDELWEISVTGNIDNDSMSLAIVDILIWARHLCQLAKVDFREPRIRINICDGLKSLKMREGIKIDSNLMKRASNISFLNRDIIFVRTDYLDEKNYFKISTSEVIKYDIARDNSKDLESISFLLYNIFGFKDFREGQLNIIINSLERRDTIGLLPTGSGKSLCYQFVAMLQPTITLVVCPIKSLMYDQKENLDKIHISNTNTITSDLKPENRDRILEEFGQGKYNFLWISPERFQIQKFRDNLRKLDNKMTIGMGVIDEVHCLSEWGHDFRTSYLNLISTLRKYSSNMCLLGLTATASSFVLEDLKKEFNLASRDIKTIESYDRDELNFYIETIPNDADLNKKVAKLLREIDRDINFTKDNSKAVLAFTRTKGGRKGCHLLSEYISGELGIEVPFYSGSMPNNLGLTDSEFNDYKIQVHKAYKKNEFPLLFATKAFGMGVDKSNIRATIHCGLPSSLESLYQEAGRAGRDKEDAHCHIIYQEDEWLNESDKLNFFREDITTSELNEIFKKYPMKKQGDILGNFFFYLNSIKGIDYDFNLMRAIIDNFARPNSSVSLSKYIIISSDKKVEVKSMEEIQKAVYRLKLLGIVDDWIVEKWEIGGKTGSVKVMFADYTDESVKEHLTSYIKRYTPQFVYEDDFIQSLGEEKYGNLAYKDKGIYEYVEFLLVWTYDNILYNRRKSIENIVYLSENYTDSKSFKKEIDRYFKFTDDTYSLDHIAQNPENKASWAELLLEYDDLEDSYKFIDREKLLDIRGSLMRMFESYRYNEGLDYIDGLSYLVLNNGELNTSSRDKLTYIHEKNKDMEDYSLLDQTMELVEASEIDNKQEISEFLCRVYPEKLEYIYAGFRDDYSLNQCIIKSSSRIKKINEVFKW